jgi:hypothetical protein
MILALQILLAVATAVLSLLAFLLLRQVGLLTRRIPRSRRFAAGLPSLEPGARCPVREFQTYDAASTVGVPAAGEGVTHLLFASFTCSMCRPILEALRSLPSDVRRRTILMMLDTEIARRFSREIRDWSLDGWTIVEAYSMASTFAIERAPYVYAVDAEGVLLEGEPLASPEDLEEFVRRHALARPRPAEASAPTTT